MSQAQETIVVSEGEKDVGGQLASPRPDPEAPIRQCDGPGLKALVQFGLAWLERHQAAINALNVYPVPDGDTGTNMVLTMQSAYQEIADCPDEDVSAIAQKVAHGALMGARGNSGVILSQIYRGFSRSLKDVHAFDSVQLAAALREAAHTAYKGVIKPVEGTILTVIRESADAAVRAAASSQDLRYILAEVVDEARQSVARTPTLLPVLADAGVVDAGGQGLLIILEGMLRYTKGESVTMDTALLAGVDLHSLHPDSEQGYGYDVQFLIHGEGLDVDAIQQTIASMGDCPLVVGDSRLVKIHVHSPMPGTPINYGASLGSLSKVIVENMQEQYQGFVLRRAQEPAAPVQPVAGIGTVIVSPGPGLTEVFKSLGASHVVSGGQTMNPSTEQLLRAIEGTPTDEVLVLPNNKNIVMAAEQAKSLSSKKVQVVPTITVPQGIAALLALNYQADLAVNASVMASAAANVETIEITNAVRSVQLNGIDVAAGEVIGLINGKLQVKGQVPSAVILDALQAIQADNYEILTLYYGESVSPAQAQEMAEQIAELYADQEVEVVDGGQPYYHYILSAE